MTSTKRRRTKSRNQSAVPAVPAVPVPAVPVVPVPIPVVPVPIPVVPVPIPVVPIPVVSQAPYLSLAKRTMVNGNAITRFFNRPGSDLKYDCPVIPSWASYWGMLTTLVDLADTLRQNNMDLANFCVLCPRYGPPDNPKYPGSGNDTQAGGGGKVAMLKNPTTQRKIETYQEAVEKEMLEELRIIGGSPDCTTVVETSFTLKGKPTQCITKIYTFKVSDCKAPAVYDTNKYAHKYHRGIDCFDKKVGFVPWGSLHECIRLIKSIPVDMSGALVDGIVGVSIVSLTKAIEMAQYAQPFLQGTFVSTNCP